MKSLLRPGLLVAALGALLLVLTALSAWWLALLGSGILAATVLVAGLAAVLVVGVAWSLARDAQEQLGELLPPRPAQVPQAAAVLPTVPAARGGFHVREARPGEVPEAYLQAVRKGAQARQAAWKVHPASAGDPHVN